MKEHSAQNESFLAAWEDLKTQGKTRKEIIEAIVKKFSLKNGHTARAWLARLADPKKYLGKYSARAKGLQQGKTADTTASGSTGEVTSAPKEAAVAN